MATETGRSRSIWYSSRRIDIQKWRRIKVSENGYRRFWRVIGVIAVDITKNNTNRRNSIPANVKLATTIRYLATGDN